jgi:hypothetical protein
MKHLISLNSKNVIGTLTVAVATAISGCASPESEDGNTQAENPQTGNKILTIEEKAEGKYVIVDEAPTSGPNKAIITDLNGTTRVLNEQEMQEFAQAEMNKVENGTSNLTAPPQQQAEDDGLGMGELLLAGAAGALLGGLAANALSNNSNYQANQQRYNQSPAYQSRVGGASGANRANSPKTSKESFFNNNKPASTSSTSTGTGSGKSSGFSFGG